VSGGRCRGKLYRISDADLYAEISISSTGIFAYMSRFSIAYLRGLSMNGMLLILTRGLKVIAEM
jgi:hypothetical protein